MQKTMKQSGKGDFTMSSYTHFTEEEKEQARNTDLVSFLRHRGEPKGNGLVNDLPVQPYGNTEHEADKTVPVQIV